MRDQARLHFIHGSKENPRTMKKKMSFAGFVIVISLSAATVFIPHPMQAKGEGAKAPAVEVQVDNFTFSPETLTVPVNSAVTWVNKDDVPHVIASNDGLFKSKALDTDQKFSYTFTKPGTYPYYCTIHPKMVGRIVVQ
jgi:plastocyanin